MKNFFTSFLPSNLIEKKIFILILILQFFQSLWAIYNYGYIGQDFETHMAYVEDYFKIWNFQGPNAPMFYWLPRFLRSFISPQHFNEILAFLFLSLNSLALIFIYPLLLNTVSSAWLRISCFLFIVFVPFRMIHSIVFAADALMIFPFFFIIHFSLLIFKNKDALIKKKYWSFIGITLFISIGQKYNILSLLPPLFLLFLMDFYHSGKSIYSKKLISHISLCFILPTAFFGYHWYESKKAGSYTTTTHWKAPAEPSKMNWNDILFFKKSDFELLRAPQYFQELHILENHRHSYPALLWMASFTDTMNFWQNVPDSISKAYGERRQRGFQKIKTDSAQKWSQVSLYAVIPILFLSFLGFLWALLKLCTTSILFLQTKKFPPLFLNLFILFSFSISFHLFMVFNLPKLAEPYQFGYWLPRYVIPSLLVYFILCFSFLSHVPLNLKFRKFMEIGILFYSLFLVGIFISIL